SKQLKGSAKLVARTGKNRKGRAADSSSHSYIILYTFCPGGLPCPGGGNSFAGLLRDAAGNLYGTVAYGGANFPDGGPNGGTVFSVDNPGQETVLYSFCSQSDCADGSVPAAGLIQDGAGNLYGTTGDGGTGASCTSEYGCGTVFKLDSSGQETVLYSFCSQTDCADGSGSGASLIQDDAGTLYGTTPEGGGGSGSSGTVYKVDSSGNETVLYSFCSEFVGGVCMDGATPVASLIQDDAGTLYGTTSRGGSNSNGTVFELDSAGKETVLYSFCSAASCTDGSAPLAGLIQDTAGNLYGTTEYGGSKGVGTVFKLAPPGQQGGTWIETVLYSFCSQTNCTDGAEPVAGLIQDAAGNLYGTTSEGGADPYGAGVDMGTVFEVNTTGQETVLYNFCSEPNCTDGAAPVAGLVQDAAGNLYGTTEFGGVNDKGGAGVVFELAAGGGGNATVSLTSSPNPSYVDQPVTLGAVVSGSGPTPTGSVTFDAGTTFLGTVTLADGQASLSTAFAMSGSLSVVAYYSGDQNYNTAVSGPLTQVVNQYSTSTAVASNLNPSTYGQAVTLTATVSSAGPTPTGTATFRNGKKSLGSATLSGGVAKLTTPALPVGDLAIAASYSGDAANKKSTSPPLEQVVNQATSTTSVTSSLNPSKVGQKVTFTATVTSPTTTPTGTVKFMDGATELGTGKLKKGKATYSTSTLSEGSHNITAVYEGTADISGSTSPVLVQTVN
ncbi:MAG: choice-of-anchor tandem repeat GloVer-containing protein, partial [Terriglobales bacterium]